MVSTKVKFVPLGERVVIKPIQRESTTRGGIYLPDTAKEKPQEGQVIAVGPGKLDEHGKRIPMEVKVGDKILFGKYTGTDIKLDGEEVLILREDEVLAVLA